VLSGQGFAKSWSLLKRSTTDCGACWMWSRNLVNEGALTHWGCCAKEKKTQKTTDPGLPYSPDYYRNGIV
jgi:hypothetical protein